MRRRIVIPSPRILLIDDEPGTTMFVSRLLEKQGFEVVVMESGEDAIKLLEHDVNFDLVLLDYLMVGLDGIETLEIIKKQPGTRQLKVVIESGLSDLEDMEKAKLLGAIGYIAKPYSPGELVKQVKEYLSK
jgi:CheY-like chemotaxis protein